MIKVKCSKYPQEKCKYAEERTFEKCADCKHNLYMDMKDRFTERQDWLTKPEQK